MSAHLSGRERVRLALEHRATDRVPIAMIVSGINPPARESLETYLQANRGVSVEEYLLPLIDVVGVAPDYAGPPLAEEWTAGEDIWGVVRKPMSYGEGFYHEMAHHPLAGVENVRDLDRCRWPSPDWFDYSTLPAKIRAVRERRDRAVIVGVGTIFEHSWYMRGFERFFADFYLNPELAHAILRRVTDFFKAFFQRVLSAAPGEIDLIQTGDDVGQQQGLLMSLDMWERFLKPYHAELNEAIHSLGAKVVYHSDGAIMKVVPGLIDVGVDCLQALQFSAAGMDPVVLKEKYGARLCFEGGVSVQTTLPFGTVETVVREVQDLVRVLGKEGGYILGPSHAIQAGTPPENIVAMFDTAAACYSTAPPYTPSPADRAR